MNFRPITGKVAKVVTTDELVLNRGSNHGVKKDMMFRVLDPRTENVLDPDTGEDLGSIKRTKARVWVTEVAPQVALAEVRVSSGLVGLARLFEPKDSPLQSRVNYLSDVRVGDPIEQVPPDSITSDDNSS